MTEKLTQAQTLIELAEDCELFRDPDLDGFATLEVAGHFEVWPIRSATFKQFLVRAFYEIQRRPPGSQALEDALKTLEAMARFDGPLYSVHRRVAGWHGNIYLDLVNEDWEVIEISPDGWQVSSDSPVKFVRAPGMLALPRPLTIGSIYDLKKIINYTNERNFILIVAWLLAALRPTGPYPVAVVLGEHGAAKTSLERNLRSLVDPSSVPVRTAPRCEEDLMIAARNSWVIAFDNLSWMPNWLSDALCRLATGGGLTKRRLYTDADEQLLNAKRPVILNSIEAIAERTDLVDRAIFIELGQIPDSERRTETELDETFRKLSGGILGALCTAVSEGLKNLPNTKLGYLPRMADFATWITACEPALGWQPWLFLKTYNSNRKGAVEKAIEVDLIASSIRVLMDGRGVWEGTATDLLDDLEEVTDERTRKAKAWPKTPVWLSRKMKRSVTFLRAVGIEVVFPGDKDKPRHIRVFRQATKNSAAGGNGGEPAPGLASTIPLNAPPYPANQNSGNDGGKLKPSSDGGSPPYPASRGKKRHLSSSTAGEGSPLPGDDADHQSGDRDDLE